MISDRLRMIACRCCDHAPRPLFLRKLKQFVERAALLVSCGELKIFELQPDFGADDFGERPADQHRRPDDRSIDALGRSANFVDCRRLHHRGAA